ncbi:protein kinase [Xanthomonas sp. NCPPB 2654]|uniref:bifunctional serine/threonine-protein kinase/formylglycine-generating enzyme family protein n=1 Tax=unclassified Xanthomonas TaxID=2643310 RepID=UPI0021DFECBA|nr:MULTISPECIES: protein kinase [unclassified Xanthomonas]MDL5364037.1 protein kinase [Xanthomonas sp. NCPPB 2654]UYC20961.1 protein kinase [Xanthomonas sp. CFBP 8443]
MHEDTATVVELVAAMRTGELDLKAVLDALAKRSAVPEADYRAGVETLWQLRQQQVLDDVTVTTLVTRLDALRADAGAAPAASIDDDATVVMPRRAVPPPAAAEDDATRVQPAMPLPQAGTDGTAATGTGGATGTAGTASLSSWQRLADAAGGDYATVGTLLKGRFYLERELGRGGMGVVYLARDERKVEARDRDPWLAVKVLSDEFRRHPDSLVALQREARRSQKLAHDNIVRVYDFDKDRTLVFMTMEYIDGCDLKTLIREQAYNGMSLARARSLIEGMARALARAHAAGVVHSDFKPGNVMVTRDGVAKVFDFGIARAGKHAADVAGEQTVFDAATLGALTPAYASLEMIRGQEPTPADDIYALGCVCFELLTGKHPFDKLSAEVALRDKRVPPPVPGLTKRQYQTLCAAVAFPAAQRLDNVEALLDGLREVPLRERALPLLGYGAAVLVLAGAGGWGASRYLHQRHLEQVTARFGAADPQRYVDETQAMQALASLDDDDRRRLLVDRGDLIQDFLLRRLDALWNPSSGRYDYRGALQVFALRDRLRLYSPALDARRESMEREKNERLNALDTTLNAQVAAGAIFRDRADNALATLDQVRRIDPNSALLRHPELELRLDAAIQQSADAQQWAQARTRLQQARAALPDSLRLQLRGAQLQLAQHDSQPAVPAPHDPAQARKALAALLAAPSADPDWQDNVEAALAVLPAAERDAQDAALAAAIADTVAPQSDPLQLPGAQALVDFGLTQAAHAPQLLAQRERLQTLQQQLQTMLARESAEAEVASRIESMRRAAAANDLDKARQALARIASLQPQHPFLQKEAPQLLAGVYLGNAAGAFRQGRYRQAADVLGQGVAALGERAELRAAQARYDVAAAVMDGGAQALPAAERQRLGQRLEALYRSDAQAMTQLETELKARGQLPEGTLGARLQRQAGSDAPSSDALAPTAAAATAPAGKDPARKPASGKPAAKPAATAPAASERTPAAGAASDEEPLPPVPTGPDPCAAAAPGRGKPCFDALGAQRGPMLVTVPGLAGGKPYALSRAEVAVADFNLFCQATGKCTAQPAGDAELARAPVRNISLTQARAYLRWLTIASGGWRYRLPTDAEWQHAAQAGSDWRQAEDSNCVPPTASAGDATRAPLPPRGREPNPWGLINLTGNVWEWVSSGAGVQARGGSFASYWADCTVQARRADNGSAQPDVGLRVLRELP